MKYEVKNHGDHKILVSGILGHSVYPPSNEIGYWRFLIPENFIPKDVLLLGLGGGTVCGLLLDKFPDVKITAIDDSGGVVETAKKEFNLDPKQVKIVINDAYKYVGSTQEKFDLIIIDLFVGEWFSYQTIAPSFLSQCQKILKDRGKIVINTINPQWMINKTFPFVTVNQQQGNIIYIYTKET